jgi:hypothetical protein
LYRCNKGGFLMEDPRASDWRDVLAPLVGAAQVEST